MEQMEESAGKKFDKGKPRLELLPPSYWHLTKSLHSVRMASWYFYQDDFPKSLSYDAVPILEFGAQKYDAHNWHRGMRWGRLVGAFHRHCNELVNGIWRPRDLDELDEESGMPHGQHAECCRIFLAEYYDRYRIDQGVIGENDCAWAEKS